MLHVNRGGVGGDVHLGDHVKQECFLDLRPIDKRVHHLRDEGNLGQKFLYNLGQSHVDGVIVDARQLEGQRDRLTDLLQEATHVALDGVQALNLLVIIHEHITVDLVDEYLVPDVGLDLASALDDLKQLLASTLVVSVMCINDINEGTAVLNMLNRVRLQHVVTWKVDDIKLDVVVVRDNLSLDITGWQQEEGLVR